MVGSWCRLGWSSDQGPDAEELRAFDFPSLGKYGRFFRVELVAQQNGPERFVVTNSTRTKRSLAVPASVIKVCFTPVHVSQTQHVDRFAETMERLSAALERIEEPELHEASRVLHFNELAPKPELKRVDTLLRTEDGRRQLRLQFSAEAQVESQEVSLEVSRIEAAARALGGGGNVESGDDYAKLQKYLAALSAWKRSLGGMDQ